MPVAGKSRSSSTTSISPAPRHRPCRAAYWLGADTYEFDGATKPGEWTDPENYERLKSSLMERSKLLIALEDMRRRIAKRKYI